MGRLSRAVFLVIGVAVLALAARAAAVPAGADLFATDPDQTSFAFQGDFAVPAGFFDPGSQPFQGDVRFFGVQLGTFAGKGVGDADTVVKRLAAANIGPPFPSTDTVPIELVGLSLQSTAPITVQVGGATQLWDVTAEPSPGARSFGTMTITKTGETGGTFDSRLTVLPLFHFTRRSDGVQRFLDLGGITLPPAALDALTLKASGVPWTTGCADPALRVAGLNDGFCPGVDPDGEKRLTLEQSQLAQHGVYVAQPPPNHYKCYVVESPRVRARSVLLSDQFGRRRAIAVRPIALCNPVKKNREPIQKRPTHLECYGLTLTRPAPPPRVVIQNQFGVDVLRLLSLGRLCLPSTTRLLGVRSRATRKPVAENHFTCYRVKGSAIARRVVLTDQFDVERVRTVRPVLLCAPARKRSEPVPHPLRHLICYQIAPLGKTQFTLRKVVVGNQFGTHTLRVRAPETLCVPSLKFRYDGGPPPLPPIPKKSLAPALGQPSAMKSNDFRPVWMVSARLNGPGLGAD